MTRPLATVASRPTRGKSKLLAPLKPPRNLVGEVARRIADQIRKGELTPGERLPTEQALMTALGISRTVVREAVAALKADGLVVTRQGSGAFVAEDARRVPFRIEGERLGSIDDVLAVMELRVAVELEAAGLAAERATPEQRREIDAALAAIDKAVARGEGAVAEDFALHRAIAAATGNRYFADFLGFLGAHVIPRQSVRVTLATPAEQRAYLERIQGEHRRIVEAIASEDAGEARRAMRIHLARSLQRYRGIAARAAVPA